MLVVYIHVFYGIPLFIIPRLYTIKVSANKNAIGVFAF